MRTSLKEINTIWKLVIIKERQTNGFFQRQQQHQQMRKSSVRAIKHDMPQQYSSAGRLELRLQLLHREMSHKKTALVCEFGDCYNAHRGDNYISDTSAIFRGVYIS